MGQLDARQGSGEVVLYGRPIAAVAGRGGGGKLRRDGRVTRGWGVESDGEDGQALPGRGEPGIALVLTQRRFALVEEAVDLPLEPFAAQAPPRVPLPSQWERLGEGTPDKQKHQGTEMSTTTRE